MKLEFSGAPEIAAHPGLVWERLVDPRFVAQSAPAVHSVEVFDPNHFRVTSSFGVGSMKASLIMDGEIFDLLPGRSARMRVRGRGPGSIIEVLSSIRVHNLRPGRVRLEWSATTELTGTLTKLGGKLIEGIARRLTEQFWDDFARRVAEN
ncbi:MAG TPA: SRPBCC domain-containing protein [Gemmatimonadales bacterium]|nr:SRPBCC domain-containing protein [Gemmatimonadales bacterium]